MASSNFSDTKIAADIDFAGKQYAAAVVGELLMQDRTMTGQQVHRILVERMQERRATQDEETIWRT